jgi:hypothetical protein
LEIIGEMFFVECACVEWVVGISLAADEHLNDYDHEQTAECQQRYNDEHFLEKAFLVLKTNTFYAAAAFF